MSENQSIVKLQNTIVDLLKNHSISELNVTGILKISGVSRTNFYRLFKDKYDLANSIYDRDTRVIIEDFRLNNDFFQLVKATTHKLHENKDYYINLLRDPEAQNSFYKYWTTSNYNNMARRIPDAELTDEMKLAIKMFVYSSMHVHMDYLQSKIDMSADDLSYYICKYMPDLMKRYFNINF